MSQYLLSFLLLINLPHRLIDIQVIFNMRASQSSNTPTKRSNLSALRLFGGSARSGRSTSRQHYPGATILTSFTTEGPLIDHAPRLTIKYETLCTPELRERLAREGTEEFDKFVGGKVNMTTKEMRDKWEFDERRTCEEDIKRQVKTYISRLTTNLDGTGINHSTDHRVDPKEDNLCQCRDLNVTGASLQFEHLAVVTRCDENGNIGESTFHTMTPSFIAEQPSFIGAPLPSLDGTQVAHRKKFLQEFNATLREGAAGHPIKSHSKWLNTAKDRNNAVMQTMKRDPAISDLEHIFKYCEDPDSNSSGPFTLRDTQFSPLGFVNNRPNGPDGRIGPVINPGGSERTYEWVIEKS